ncbi:Succinyl-diaminopimelate desuccinylase [Bienertia sinuspersici]
MDGKNEIFPIAYAVGVDLALKKVWPDADRRYCCRHSSRNFKKEFPGPLMYILFYRACNATNPYTFRKAMERLRKEGKATVMKWFADLGKQSKWTKNKFNTTLCSDINTSNFVESFNSTLGIDKCKPILSLLEGIRRVCMVRPETRQQQAETWDENDIFPKIAQMVKDIGKATKFCECHMLAPGEFEIHEGKSQFPISINQRKYGYRA